MTGALFLFSVLAFLGGLGIFAGARGALHEIEGLILLFTSALFFVGGAICSRLNRRDAAATPRPTEPEPRAAQATGPICQKCGAHLGSAKFRCPSCKAIFA